MGSIPIILDMHAEDAAILWVQRNRAVDAPHFNRKFLARLDERLEANLDGLRIGGRAGWDAARAAYDAYPEAGEVCTLAALAFGAGSKRGMAEIFDIIEADKSGKAVRAAISGLGWLDPNSLRGLIQPVLDHPNPQIRALGVGACAVHRVNPGDQLDRLIKDAPVVRSMALKLAGLLGLSHPAITISKDDDDDCAYYAAWALVRAGDKSGALSALWRIAAGEGPHQMSAFEMATLASDPNDIGPRLRDFGPFADAFSVQAAGRVGRLDMVDWLIQKMTVPTVARWAGESFSMITGADLAFLDLDAPPDQETGPNDDPNDPLVDLDQDENLPVPDANAVQAWWAKHVADFNQASSYILGQPVSEQAYLRAFETGFQRQSRVAALAIGLGQPAQPLLNWKARQHISKI